MRVSSIVYRAVYRIPTLYSGTWLVFPLHISVNSALDLGVPEEHPGAMALTFKLSLGFRVM